MSQIGLAKAAVDAMQRDARREKTQAQEENFLATQSTGRADQAIEGCVNPSQVPTVLLAQPTGQLNWLERLGLVLLAATLGAVLLIARWLNPYDAQGQPRQLGTHEQMGLPPCGFYRTTGIPCPTCGLTTSFSLCLHGNWRAAWRANRAGPILVLAIVLNALWFTGAGVTGRRLGLPSWLGLSTFAAYCTLALVLGSWLVRLVRIYYGVE